MGKRDELVSLKRVLKVVKDIQTDLLEQAKGAKTTEGARELRFAANSMVLLGLTLQSQSVIDFMRSQGR